MLTTAPVSEVKKTLLRSAIWALVAGVLFHVFVLYWGGQHPVQSAPIEVEGSNAAWQAILITLHYWVSLGVFVFYGWISLASSRLKKLKAEAYVLEDLYKLRMILGVTAMVEGVTVFWAQPEAISTVFMPFLIVVCLKFFFCDVFQSVNAS
jgi:hypothetical protein